MKLILPPSSHSPKSLILPGGKWHEVDQVPDKPTPEITVSTEDESIEEETTTTLGALDVMCRRDGYLGSEEEATAVRLLMSNESEEISPAMFFNIFTGLYGAQMHTRILILFRHRDLIPQMNVEELKFMLLEEDPPIAELTQKILAAETQLSVSKRSLLRLGQRAVDYNYPMPELSADVSSSQRLELDHFVKPAPNFREQAADPTRDNFITYVGGYDTSLALENDGASRDIYKAERRRAREHELMERYLSDIEKLKELHPERDKDLVSLVDDLTFIGEREYQEATQNIAEYWKYLIRDKHQKLVVLGGNEFTQFTVAKSTTYMFDTILSNFDDRTMAELGTQITTEIPENSSADELARTRVIIPDDWIISGKQARNKVAWILSEHPELNGHIEFQLIVANEHDVKYGLPEVSDDMWALGNHLFVPIRGYFVAHRAKSSGDHDESRSTHITGAHSSTDFGFELPLREIVRSESSVESMSRQVMPALTNIVRPYREADFRMRNIERFRAAKQRA